MGQSPHQRAFLGSCRRYRGQASPAIQAARWPSPASAVGAATTPDMHADVAAAIHMQNAAAIHMQNGGSYHNTKKSQKLWLRIARGK